MAEHTREELEDLTVPELKDVAEAEGVEGYSTMRKAELIDAIIGETAGTEVEEQTKSRTTTVRRPVEDSEDGEVETVEVERSSVDRVSVGDGTVVAGTIDRGGIERREAARARQADRPGRVRPVPASIDPDLVERRKAQAEADAERNRPRSVTAPPPRGR